MIHPPNTPTLLIHSPNTPTLSTLSKHPLITTAFLPYLLSPGKQRIDREASGKSLDAEIEVGALLGDRKMKRLRMPKSISMSKSSSSLGSTSDDKPSKSFDFDNDEYTDDGAAALNGISEDESDEDMLSKALMGDSVCICQRCFRLQQYGQVEENLRPGWSDHELLTPERFEDLLTGIQKQDLSDAAATPYHKYLPYPPLPPIPYH